MGATNEADRLRLMIEDVLADLMSAEEHLRCAGLKAMQAAKTRMDAEVVAELLEARTRVECARQGVARLHPNGRR